MGDKIAVLGRGYMAKKILGVLPPEDVVYLEPFDITDIEACGDAIESRRIKILINAAGFTGRPNVDGCESQPLCTIGANALGPVNLASICQALDIYLVHLGSGCVFEGDNGGKGWTEDDEPNFYGSLYSATKAMSERALKTYENVLQLRIRMPLDGVPHPRNLLTKLLAFKNVISIPNSVTVISDFLVALKRLMSMKATGIYNLTNPGAITHPEILELYRTHCDPTHSYGVFTMEECRKTMAAGRSNCILSSEKLERDGVYAMRPVTDSVEEAVIEYARHIKGEMGTFTS